METNALPSDSLSAEDLDSQAPETVVRAWIRSLAVREETYHAARQRVLALFEEEYLHWLMQRTAGNRSKAARIAGVTRRTVYRLAAHHPNGKPEPRPGAESRIASPWNPEFSRSTRSSLTGDGPSLIR
jgi:DNA-binding NtrC family response regulator